MEVDEDISSIESNASEDCPESFGDISCITAEGNHLVKEIESDASDVEGDPEDSSEKFGDISCITGDGNNFSNEIKSNICDTEVSILESSRDLSLNTTAVVEISDVLDLVGKKWAIYCVSPLWNLQFKKSYLNSLSQQLKKYLISNLKKQKQLSSQMDVEIEAKEDQEECIALKIQVNNTETNTQLYTGVLLKSPDYTEKYNTTKLSEMPVLMVHGNSSFILAVHKWFTEHFDCMIQPYEFAFYQVLWLIAISMGDAGHLYNKTVSYHYLLNYEMSKGKMDVICSVEPKFLRSTLSKISSAVSENTSFHYSHLLKIHTEIEDHFKMTSGINVSKLKLIAFKAPNLVSINISGKVYTESSTLMDLIINYLMELINKS